MYERHTETTIPMTWDGWDQQDTAAFSFYNVEFTEDFGSIKKDDKFTSVMVDFQRGKFEAYDDSDESNILHSINFVCKPV